MGEVVRVGPTTKARIGKVKVVEPELTLDTIDSCDGTGC